LKKLKRIIVLQLAALMLISLSFSGFAQAVSPGIIWPPGTIQASVGERFAISLSINAGDKEVIFGGVWAQADTTGITFEEASAGLILPANSSTRVNIFGIADKIGLYRVRIDLALDGVIQTSEIPLQVSDPDAQIKRPRLSITGSAISPGVVDVYEPFMLKVELTNIGSDNAVDPVITFDGGRNFKATTLTNIVELPSVEAGKKVDAVFHIKALESRESNIISINLSYGAFTRTETLNLPLPDLKDKPEKLAARFKVSSFELLAASEEKLTLNLVIQNTGEVDAKNINITLDGGDRLFTAGSGKTARISILPAGNVTKLRYTLAFRGKLSNHPVNLSFEFQDADGQLHKSSDTIFVSHDAEPLLKISGFNIRASDTEGEFALSLDIRNKGNSKAQSIEVRFVGNQTFPLQKSNLVLLDDIAAGNSKRLTVDMRTVTQTDAYQIPVEIIYRSSGGAEHKTSEIITLSAASIGIEKAAYEGLQDVFLDRYALSEVQVYAGESFTMTLYIKNNSMKTIGTTKILLGTGNVQGATVFLPLDGRHSYITEGIEPGGYLIKEIALLADHNALATVHSLPISIEYEDEEGKLSKITAILNIPVQHRGQINIFSIDIPETAIVGENVPVAMEFANAGRIALNSVLAAIEGDFVKEDATYFIPQFAVGISDFFQGTIIPGEAGMLSGYLVITYLDSRNNEVRIENPFTIEIQPAIAADGTETGEQKMPDGFLRPDVSLPVVIFGTLGIILLVIAATVLILRKGKLKRDNAA